MKTEKELKDALEDIFFDALTDKSNPPYYTDKVDPENDGRWQYKVYELCADELIKRGYGDVSEYKAEIERLKAENEKMRKERGYINQLKEELLLKHYHVDCYQEEIKKQAKIDALKELKTRHDYAIKNMGYPWDISQQIDELIKEIEKGRESGRHDRHVTPNDNKLEIIVVKELQEVEK